jgi:hypothetical protein
VERSRSLPAIAARVRQLRFHRQLVNAFIPLLAAALAVLVFRFMFPWTFTRLEIVWTADVLLLVALGIPWLLLSWAFASGKIKCPSCEARFACRFHLWVPKACESCGYDVTAAAKHRTS